MSDVAIRVQNLSKQYSIGGPQARYQTFRDALVQAAGAPLRWWKGGRAEQNTIWALDDISFEIKHGEAVGIIGRNGAGKSTLLKVLSRITKPTRGRVDLFGRVGSLLEVGTGFHPELTGRENIFLNGAILGMTRREIGRQFDEIVDFAEIEKFLDTPVKHYSSGMYVRLAFAVAAHLEPDILVVDEVLAVGDAAFQKKCLGKMGNVTEEGRTVLLVSHNMPAIESLSQKVMLLQAGQVKLYGDDPSRVIAYYISEGSNRDLAEVDLVNHPGRSHSQEQALRKVWVKNKFGIKTNSILMGEGIQIFFEFHCSRSILNPGFGFGIEDEYGRRIFSLNNYIDYRDSNEYRIIRTGVASLEIPSLILLPGTYYISISLVENQNDWIDFVEQALAISVEATNVYSSGKIPDKTQGIVYIPGQINVIAESIE